MSAPSDPNRSQPSADRPALSRRNFLKSAGGVAAGGVLTHGLLANTGLEAAGTAAPEVETLSGEIDVRLSINGEEHKLRVEPRTTLLNALRNHCDPPLTGAKLVCDRGNCGACTVLVDNKPAYACMLLAADLRDRKIRRSKDLARRQADLCPCKPRSGSTTR